MERNHQKAMRQPALCGLVISRDAWLAHIAQDHELHLQQQDGDAVLVSWNDREAIFCHRHGLLTAPLDDHAALGKLDRIAQSSSEGQSASSSGRAAARRCISRIRAAAFVAVAGLLAVGFGKAWLDSLRPMEIPFTYPILWMEFCARALFMSGATALFTAAALALSGLLPWKGRTPVYVAMAFGASLVALFTR